MTDAELLADAIAKSGLSSTQFARILVRDPRQVRRWLAGRPLPLAVRRYLETFTGTFLGGRKP